MSAQSSQHELDARGPLAAARALPATLEWFGGDDGVLRIIDQTQLPRTLAFRDCASAADVWDAVQRLQVRGAPAIGIAAAYGVCLGLRPFRTLPATAFLAKAREVAEYLISCRPTAVNLAWAVQQMLAAVAQAITRPGSATGPDSTPIWKLLLNHAHAMSHAEADACRRIGEHGAHLVPEGGGVLTHCNAGALATVAYGTALAVLYAAHARGRRFHVYADETRPLLQGARLTAYELHAAGLAVTVLCDGAAASLMQAGRVQLVVVGADRIAANGDVANKIGTYSVALAARHHAIPFYVAAPASTFDLSIATGASIPIELRPEGEVRSMLGTPCTPAEVPCYNPAFDVTPAGLVAGIVTERGLIQPVTAERIRSVLDFAARTTCGNERGAS
ncbi:MAG: S-methyl-5-thioribose-1-phosphate isomerase [Planctomycetota bacterium]